MSAAILALPNAAPSKIAQRKHRGPLPKTVRSLGAYRLDREKEREQLHAANVARVKELFIPALARVLRGEVAGVAILESSATDGSYTASVAGEFSNDFSHLQRALDKFVDAVPRWARDREVSDRQAREEGGA